MSEWQPLSVRDGRATDDGPYDGVPSHLYLPLREWVDSTFGGNSGSQADHEGGPKLVAAARIPIVLPRGRGGVTVRQVTDALSEAQYLMSTW